MFIYQWQSFFGLNLFNWQICLQVLCLLTLSHFLLPRENRRKTKPEHPYILSVLHCFCRWSLHLGEELDEYLKHTCESVWTNFSLSRLQLHCFVAFYALVSWKHAGGEVYWQECLQKKAFTKIFTVSKFSMYMSKSNHINLIPPARQTETWRNTYPFKTAEV